MMLAVDRIFSVGFLSSLWRSGDIFVTIIERLFAILWTSVCYSLLCVDSLEGCDEDDRPVRAATIAAQYSLLNYGQLLTCYTAQHNHCQCASLCTVKDQGHEMSEKTLRKCHVWLFEIFHHNLACHKHLVGCCQCKQTLLRSSCYHDVHRRGLMASQLHCWN